MKSFLRMAIFLIAAGTISAFVPAHARRAHFATTTSTSIYMAGFGGAAKKGSKKKELKPKTQWDRYTDLKTTSVSVAVRVMDTSEWFPVGAVRSQDDAHTEAAVIRHRVLITDHARRMFPIQILAKDKVEFAFMQGEEWVVAGKVDMPDDIDKRIGFVGLADPSGFYARSRKMLSDNTVSGFDSMKKKGITGHVGFEVHD
jgi:hypothetical protein